MWTFTRYGFFSIASFKGGKKEYGPDLVLVRTRSESHLKNLQERFPSIAGAAILPFAGTDYPYRISITKEEWIRVLSQLAQEQDWYNFKGEAARFLDGHDSGYTSALHDIWAMLRRSATLS